MKRILFISFLIVSHVSLEAQINAGADDTICSGQATLTATLNNAGTATNMPQPWCDDCFSPVVNIGFAFTYYGNTYTQCVISSNNYISFNISQANGASPWSIPSAVPNPGLPLNATMGPWQDIHPGIGGLVRYATTGAAPNRVFVVEYCNIPMFSCTNMAFSSQIQLHENGNVVETHIITKPVCATWNGGKAIHAMHNSNGTLASVVPGRNNPAQWSTSLEGYRFTPTSPTTYAQTLIPFNPVILGATGTITWEEAGGATVGTGTTITVSPTSTTSYVASITDACSGQTFTDTMQVVVSPTFNFNGSATQRTSCVQATGTATVNIQNGSGSYHFQWDAATGNQTGFFATGLDSGLYQVTVTDLITGCIRDTTFYIDNSNSVVLAVASQTNVSCFNGNNGSATVSFTGGTAPYTFIWSNGDTNATANNLSQGIYTVLVTDNHACSMLLPITITQPTAGNLVFGSQQNILCAGGVGGQVTAVITGGTAPYNYVWSPSGQTTSTLSGVIAGTYTVVATDANGCQVSGNVTLTEPAALTVSVTGNSALCSGSNSGSATATPIGGTLPYTYSWTGGGGSNAMASNIAAGIYTVTVTDNNGCAATNSITISQPTAITLTFSSTPSECGLATGTGTASASGGIAGYTYWWGNGNTTPTATGLPQGYNVVIVTDGNGCQVADSVAVGMILSMTANAAANPVWGVYPLEVTFLNTTSGGGVIYDWDYGDGTVQTGINAVSTAHTYTEPGTYTAMMIAYNAGGCNDTTYITIEVVNESVITMPNVFSPNGDGENDEFRPIFTQAIVSYTLTVFNRWGVELYTSTIIEKGWDGGDQTNGTYFYTVRAIGVDNKVHELKGSVTLFGR